MNEETKNTQETSTNAEGAAKNPETKQKGWFAKNWPWVTACGAVLLAAGGAALMIFSGSDGDIATPVA